MSEELLEMLLPEEREQIEAAERMDNEKLAVLNTEMEKVRQELIAATTPQPDAHTLNACLARVIGVEIFKCEFGVEWTSHTGWGYGVNGKIEEWNPLHDANQMELVEAWFVKDFNIEYTKYTESNLWGCCVWKDKDGQTGADLDKKRAFALAVQAMEQAQNGR